MNIPICCIAYNRVNSLKRLLNSLAIADYDKPVTLIISIDKSDTTEVEEYADSYQWPHGEKRIIKYRENLGLRRHVLSCGDLLKEYDALVVLEDDITVAQSFYYYAQQCVEQYQDCRDCAGISLYSFSLNYHNCLPFSPIYTDSDIYLMNCAQSWGQIWMKKQWFEFRRWYDVHKEDFSNLPNLPKSICSWPRSSWLKYHTRYCIEENKFFIYPYISLSTNNGDSGTHNKTRSSLFQVPLLEGQKKEFKLSPSVEYDGFFENKKLADYLKVDAHELCVDFYGEKQNNENKRYWLTSAHASYRVMSSYALELKPWDRNIKYNIEGESVFLYDTEEKCKNHFPRNDEVRTYLYAFNKTDKLTVIKNQLKKVIRQMRDYIKKV